MNKDTRLTFRLPTKTREALEAAAAAERRSVANLLDIIVTDWLEAKGHLPKAAKRTRGERE